MSKGIHGVDIYEIKNKKSEDPVWILQRQPQPDKGETYIQIWIKDDAFKVSPVKLCRILADVIGSLLIKRKQP